MHARAHTQPQLQGTNPSCLCSRFHTQKEESRYRERREGRWMGFVEWVLVHARVRACMRACVCTACLRERTATTLVVGLFSSSGRSLISPPLSIGAFVAALGDWLCQFIAHALKLENLRRQAHRQRLLACVCTHACRRVFEGCVYVHMQAISMYVAMRM